jgi:hypothetical protein
MNDLQNQCIANHQVNEALRENMCTLTQKVHQNTLLLQQVLEALKNLSQPNPAQPLQDVPGTCTG